MIHIDGWKTDIWKNRDIDKVMYYMRLQTYLAVGTFIFLFIKWTMFAILFGLAFLGVFLLLSESYRSWSKSQK